MDRLTPTEIAPRVAARLRKRLPRRYGQKSRLHRGKPGRPSSNDRYGHPGPDALIDETALALRRAGDLIAEELAAGGDIVFRRICRLNPKLVRPRRIYGPMSGGKTMSEGNIIVRCQTAKELRDVDA